MRTGLMDAENWRRSAHHALLHRPQRRGGPGRDANLVVNVLDVVIGRLGRDEESIRNLTRRETAGGEAQDVNLAFG